MINRNKVYYILHLIINYFYPYVELNLNDFSECKSTNLENVSAINYSEETPLMFSRCSSLGSLSECSVPDQPDDVGSVVSEFRFVYFFLFNSFQNLIY